MKGQNIAMIVMSALAIIELMAICILVQYLPLPKHQNDNPMQQVLCVESVEYLGGENNYTCDCNLPGVVCKYIDGPKEARKQPSGHIEVYIESSFNKTMNTTQQLTNVNCELIAPTMVYHRCD